MVWCVRNKKWVMLKRLGRARQRHLEWHLENSSILAKETCILWLGVLLQRISPLPPIYYGYQVYSLYRCSRGLTSSRDSLLHRGVTTEYESLYIKQNLKRVVCIFCNVCHSSLMKHVLEAVLWTSCIFPHPFPTHILCAHACHGKIQSGFMRLRSKIEQVFLRRKLLHFQHLNSLC